MQATKVMFRVDVECLSIDAISSLVGKAMENLYGEIDSGTLHCDDGDCVSWTTEKVNVEF